MMGVAVPDKWVSTDVVPVGRWYLRPCLGDQANPTTSLLDRLPPKNKTSDVLGYLNTVYKLLYYSVELGENKSTNCE